MTNRITEGREYLEAKKPGLFAEFVHDAYSNGGIVHLAPDCLLIGKPCLDAPRTLYVMFQCSQLCSLCRVLLSLSDSYDRVRWIRDWKGGYAPRERDIKDFARHLKLGYNISKF